MTVVKPSRIKDPKALAEVRGKPCLICKAPSDPCHIRSKGAGGDDTSENLIALCRRHHREQHQVGWARFSRKYLPVLLIFHERGLSVTDEGKLTKK